MVAGIVKKILSYPIISSLAQVIAIAGGLLLARYQSLEWLGILSTYNLILFIGQLAHLAIHTEYLIVSNSNNYKENEKKSYLEYKSIIIFFICIAVILSILCKELIYLYLGILMGLNLWNNLYINTLRITGKNIRTGCYRVALALVPIIWLVLGIDRIEYIFILRIIVVIIFLNKSEYFTLSWILEPQKPIELSRTFPYFLDNISAEAGAILLRGAARLTMDDAFFGGFSLVLNVLSSIVQLASNFLFTLFHPLIAWTKAKDGNLNVKLVLTTSLLIVGVLHLAINSSFVLSFLVGKDLPIDTMSMLVFWVAIPLIGFYSNAYLLATRSSDIVLRYGWIELCLNVFLFILLVLLGFKSWIFFLVGSLKLVSYRFFLYNANWVLKNWLVYSFLWFSIYRFGLIISLLALFYINYVFSNFKTIVHSGNSAII